MNQPPVSPTNLLVECYGATRPQQRRTATKDAFWIGRDPVPAAVVRDGAGNARQSARRVITLFQKLWTSATMDQVREPETWGKWIHLLDSHLMGMSQSTFLGLAVFNDHFVGAYAGDSRAYLSTSAIQIELSCFSFTCHPPPSCVPCSLW
jgi:hypothetical protein